MSSEQLIKTLLQLIFVAGAWTRRETKFSSTDPTWQNLTLMNNGAFLVEEACLIGNY